MVRRIPAKDSEDAKINIADNIPRQNHEVSRVKIGVKHAVPESVSKKIINKPAGKQVRNKVRAMPAAPGTFVPKILRYGHAIQKLRCKDARRCVLPEHSRYLFKGIVSSVVFKFIHVVGFVSVVKLVLRPSQEFFCGLDDPIKRFEP